MVQAHIDIDEFTKTKLASVIEQRNRILNQTTEQSITALTIQTLKSLRAATSKSKGKFQPVDKIQNNDLDVEVQPRPQYVVGFKKTGETFVPCIRVGDKKGQVVELNPWWQVNHDKDIYTAKVFYVTLSAGRQLAWPYSRIQFYMVARNLEAAKKILSKRYGKIVQRYAGLGKDALSKAMMLASNRPAKFIAGPKSKSVLNRNVDVQKTSMSSGFGSGDYSITVSDNLRYAGTACKIDVNSAMQKACNSVIGYINSRIRNGNTDKWFERPLEIPFPSDMLGE